MSGIIISDPVTLQVALSSNRIIPGDIILLCNGTFTGDYISRFTGTAAKPIIIQPQPGATVIIDGSLKIYSPYTIWKNIIFTTSAWASRTTNISGSDPADMPVDKGVSLYAQNIRFINNIIHNHSSFWSGYESEGSEIYGNIMFNMGWSGPDRGHIHGLYTQNYGLRKTIKDNISFQNFSTGLKFYGSTGYSNNYDIIGNTCFNNGILYDRGMGTFGAHANWNFLIGSWIPTSTGMFVKDNMSYWPFPYPAGSIGDHSNNLCSGNGDVNPPTGGLNAPTFQNNYFAGKNADFMGTNRGPLINPTVIGNTFIGDVPNDINFPLTNNYYSFPYSINRVVVRPNTYDTERAGVTIYNWELLNTVVVDLTAVTGLSVGDDVYVKNVQDLFVDIATLTLDANKQITIDMRAISHTVAAPTLWTAPPTTFPTFGCFIIQKA